MDHKNGINMVYAIITAEQQLLEFCEKCNDSIFPKNKWLDKDRSLHVYVRKSRRLLNDTIYRMLDIGNVEACPKGKGRFTEFLQYAINSKLKPFQGIFVENVLENRFQTFFRKLGWKEYYPNKEKDGPPSFYLIW